MQWLTGSTTSRTSWRPPNESVTCLRNLWRAIRGHQLLRAPSQRHQRQEPASPRLRRSMGPPFSRSTTETTVLLHPRMHRHRPNRRPLTRSMETERTRQTNPVARRRSSLPIPQLETRCSTMTGGWGSRFLFLRPGSSPAHDYLRMIISKEVCFGWS